MTVAIIDDEQHCTDRLLSFLGAYRDNLEVVCFNTVDNAIKGIETHQPEIVFLDIQLNNKTGFDVLSSISFNDFSLIFTTAFEQYAIDAFKFSAIDYLLKPIGREEFDCALRKAFERQKQNQLSERISVLLSHLSDVKIAKRISIPSKDGYNFIHIADIVRCEADINYTHIFTRDRKKFTVAKPLKYFEGLLVPCGFFRIHNSHLVNLDCVKSYAKSGYITLMDNMRLDVSLRRKEEFLKVCKGL